MIDAMLHEDGENECESSSSDDESEEDQAKPAQNKRTKRVEGRVESDVISNPLDAESDSGKSLDVDSDDSNPLEINSNNKGQAASIKDS